MFAETLRQFWTEGLNSITGPANKLFLETLDERSGYVFYAPIEIQLFKSEITDYDLFLRGYAGDISRFGCAAIESMHDIHYKNYFSKSHSWKCIKSYYAAYYAAHALLRMHGVSCTNFERDNLNRIEDIADIYGMKNGISIEKGYYQCILNSSTKSLLCKKIVAAGNKGSHEQLWSVFLEHLQGIIVTISALPVNLDRQKILAKLLDLKNTLTYNGSNGGNWLSKVRNEISYKHKRGLWYPYKDAEKHFDRIETLLQSWEKAPELIDLSTNYDKPILRFLEASVFIVALYLNSAKEMSVRCPKGNSFQKQGVLALLNKINT